MTLLVDRDAANGVHVLIVSVGAFDGDAHDNLPGARLTAERLAKWWLSSGNRLLPGSQLASVDVLISDVKPAHLPNHAGSIVQIEPARYELARNAIRNWVDRSKDGALAVLHWIGHGEVHGAEGGVLHALYCQDVNTENESSWQQALDWNKVRRGIETRLSIPVACFVDTCRNFPARADGEGYSGAWDSNRAGKRSAKLLAYYAADLCDHTYCVKPGVSVCGEFDGGALFSEATLAALDRFGAARVDSGIGPAAHPSEVFEALQARLDRWCRRTRELKKYHIDPQSDGAWEPGQAIVRIPSPMAMIDLIIEGTAQTERARCAIFPDRGQPEPTKVDDHWEADLVHADDWIAELTLQSGWFPRTADIKVNHNFRALRPYHRERIVMKGAS